MAALCDKCLCPSVWIIISLWNVIASWCTESSSMFASHFSTVTFEKRKSLRMFAIHFSTNSSEKKKERKKKEKKKKKRMLIFIVRLSLAANRKVSRHYKWDVIYTIITTLSTKIKHLKKKKVEIHKQIFGVYSVSQQKHLILYILLVISVKQKR